MAEVEQGAFSGALTGAAAGAAAGGPVGALIGGGVGLAGGMIGGKGAKKSRQAAEAAARARQIEVGKYYEYQNKLAQRIETAINDPREMASLTTALGTAERDLGRQEQLLNAMDPALKEAAAQTLSILQGKESASLAPLREDRQRQRQTLLNTLRAQLGPGAENSSAGQQALNRFDSETSNVMSQNQQSTLSNLFQIADRGTSYNLNAGTQNLANLSGAKLSRIMGGTGMQSDLMGGAWKAKTGVAGSEFTGKMMQGQYQNQLGGQIAGAAGGLGGLGDGASLSGLFSGGGSSPSVADNPLLNRGMPGMGRD